MPSTSALFPPSRRALAAVCALFFTLFVLNALLHAPRESLSFGAPFPFFSSAATPADVEDTRAQESTIVFSLVVYGRASADEGQHMLKSILLHTSRPVELHVICSDDARALLQKRFELVTRPAVNVTVVFYPLAEDAIVERARRAGIGSAHHAGVGGLAKMLMHELIPAPRALYVDTDSMFVADPLLLWRALLSAPPQALLSFPHAGNESTGADICTCVMALHLDRMRAAPFLESTLRPETVTHGVGSAAVWAAAGIDPLKAPWGDQGLVHAMWRAKPDLFGRLSRSWDISACKYYYGVTLVGGDARTPAEESAKVQNLGADASDAAADGVLFPGLVHFNCQNNEDSVFDSAALRARPEWGPLLHATARYKWVWLNQGAGRLTTRVVRDATFEDERIAGARTPTRLGGGAHHGSGEPHARRT